MITAIDRNTALVLIDLQKGILGMPVAHPVKDILEKSAMLVSAFRKANLPVVVVNVIPANSAWLKSRKDIIRSTASLPAEFSEIVEQVKTQPNDIFITKGTWNAFYNTALHAELQKRNVTGIVMAGVATSRGVEGTVRAASELGYNISIASDAITDMKMESHQHSIQVIFPSLAEVGTIEDIIEKLSDR